MATPAQPSGGARAGPGVVVDSTPAAGRAARGGGALRPPSPDGNRPEGGTYGLNPVPLESCAEVPPPGPQCHWVWRQDFKDAMQGKRGRRAGPRPLRVASLQGGRGHTDTQAERARAQGGDGQGATPTRGPEGARGPPRHAVISASSLQMARPRISAV